MGLGLLDSMLGPTLFPDHVPRYDPLKGHSLRDVASRQGLLETLARSKLFDVTILSTALAHPLRKSSPGLPGEIQFCTKLTIRMIRSLYLPMEGNVLLAQYSEGACVVMLRR